MVKKSFMSLITKILKSFKKEFLLLFLFLLAESIILASSVLTIIPFADYLLDPELKNPSKVTIVTKDILTGLNIEVGYFILASIFVFTNIIRSFFVILIEYAILSFKFSITRSLTKELLDSIFSSNWLFFNNLGKGKLLNTLSKEMTTVGDTSRQLAVTLATIVQLITYLFIPFYLDFYLTLYTLLLIFILCIPFILLNKVSHRVGTLTTQTANKVVGSFNESIQAAKIILGFGNKQSVLEKNIRTLNENIKYALQTMLLRAIPGAVFKPLAILSVIISIGITMNVGDNLSEYVAVFWSLYAIMPLISNLLKSNIVINNFLPSYEQLVSLTQKAKENLSQNGDLKFKTLDEKILFNNVSFNYPDNKPIIKNFNFDIKKNKITAIVGKSGMGKSTISDLVLGLLEPIKGEILIDGKNLKLFDKETYRNKIGYVPQDPFLFYGSIKENLIWGNKDAKEEDVIKSLKLANAYDFVMNLKNKINTLVGERGSELSGGERQRIALARALIRKPELLILDEATNSLDVNSEKKINDTLKEISGFTTILLIAHQSSSYKISNYIFEIKDEKINQVQNFNSIN